ncbi:MAG: hypothetical protein CMO55_11615 [Verrucomicrobiales bacterium]|nr:hypothetical protein [Verrucomicrobiales bacterium]
MRTPHTIILTLATLLSAGLTNAADRVALVIGNNAYENVATLDNPLNDARAVAGQLQAGGYEVIKVEDGGVNEMSFALKKFARAAAGADVAVFFYAGHGFEVNQKNYLAPVDANLEIDPNLSGEDQELALDFALDRETIPLEDIMRELRDSVSGLKLVVLDCCRNNPFAKSRSWARTRSGDSGGLAKVSEKELPEGTMMVFSGEPGKAVPDGAGNHSPFTSALLAELDAKKNAGMMLLFTGVSQRIESDQKPWLKFDGTGASVAAFVDEPLIPGDATPGSVVDTTPAKPDTTPAPEPGGNSNMQAELEKLRAEMAQKEKDAEMAAEIAKLKQQLADMQTSNTPTTPPPAPQNSSRNFNQSQWVIACEAEDSRNSAQAAASRWSARGFPSGVLWIPDYSSLSGAKLWLVYVGPWDYNDRGSVQSTLNQVVSYYRDAYGIKIDQSGKRETIAP